MEEPTMKEVYEMLGRTYAAMVHATEERERWLKHYVSVDAENAKLKKTLEETKTYLERLKEGVQNGVPMQNDSEGV